MKKGIFLILLVFASPVFAVQTINKSTFVFFDALMWRLREVSDDNWGQVLGPTGKNQQIKFLDVPFQWKPGLRVGVGYNDQEKPWDLVFYYTGYKTKGINEVAINTGEIHSAFSGNFYANNLDGDGISGPYYHQAGMKWNVLFNTLDLELGRAANINRLLKLRPFIGLKGALINQDIYTNWQTPFKPTTFNNPTPTRITTFSSATETINNHFKGVGPSFGLDTTWHLVETSKQGFNLIGNISGAILWGRWTLADRYLNNTPISITIMNDSLSTAVPMARGYLGVEWTTVINKADLNIHLGYEGQLWFGQLRFYSFDMGKLHDALSLQGGVLGLGLHF